MRAPVQVLCLALCGALLLSGCLGSTYEIPTSEMQRLSLLPPQERSQSVRVVQEATWGDEAPEVAPQPTYIHSTTYVGPGGAPPGGGTRGAGSAPGKASASEVDAPSIPVRDSKAMAVVVLVFGAFFTVGLMATEGSRYDGWVSLQEEHPVHLLQRDGGYLTMPLSQVEPSDVRDARRVLISQHQGPVEFLGRAPLDRRGFTWQMHAGVTNLLTSDGANPLFPGGTLELGYFFHEKVGLVGTLSLAGGRHIGGDVFGSRYGLEVQGMPLELGKLHLGGYGQIGQAYDASEGGFLEPMEELQAFYGVGGLLEVELTTRMALVVRSGAMWWGGPSHEQSPALVTSLGVAIY